MRLEKRSPAPSVADGNGADIELVRRPIDSRDNSPNLLHLQAQHVRRFRYVSWPLARVVAELASGNGRPLPQLTAERAREPLAYDPETGILTWKFARPGIRAGTEAGTVNSDGYIQIEIDYRLYKAHRVAWLIVTGAWPEHNLDPRNRVRDDNRWENLRKATSLQNCWNRSPSKRNKSSHIGVCFDKARGRWSADIGCENRTLHLGCYEVKEDAVEARCAAEKYYFGDFAAQMGTYRREDPADA